MGKHNLKASLSRQTIRTTKSLTEEEAYEHANDRPWRCSMRAFIWAA
jgi:hypothetical protein